MEGVSDLKTSTVSCFRLTWLDFCAWNIPYCQEALDGLQVSHLATMLADPSSGGRPVRQSKKSQKNRAQEDSNSFEEFDIWNRYSKPSSITAEIYIVPESMSAYPSYESCPPTYRSHMIEDDPDPLPFIPLSDDPTFNFQLHVDDYKYFAWNVASNDPDLEVVSLETARRLTADNDLTLVEIDETEVLPIILLSGERPGLLQTSQHRDFPPWPKNVSLREVFPISRTYTGAGPSGQLSDLFRSFCNNQNCTIGYCVVHTKDIPLPKAVPAISMTSLLPAIEGPCGSECCLLVNINSIKTYWTDEDVEMMNSVVKYVPETSPCDIAVIIRKPCFEIYKRRLQATTVPARLKRGKPVRQTRKVIVKGCNCAKNKTCIKNSCSTDNCPCFRAHRECDLLMCTGCCPRDVELNICRNASIQQGRFKPTAVRQSKWGLGLFLRDEDADKQDLIAEYTGEVFYEATVLSRHDVAEHIGRNYVFQLKNSLSIDAAKAGNETRYINHSSKPNCWTKILSVNGEHRIGVFAAQSIKAGSEILIDYGKEFFRDYKPENTQMSVSASRIEGV
ncbi:hypothetical protein BDQ12DRAFT_739238 [Crucibulum laeve]|uniref:SET domain-containing protein n=1 Tax=Crucibulum laeve TaxID=68775 RepID=A0A5C3LJ61_9AGAR|nr:hypothetical protein BDQ12DRAFT_739238 [Crucibulum laeve]